MSSSSELKTFTPARVLFDGMSAGWVGMCSPDVSALGGQYVLRFNSWGTVPGRLNQLFYSTSTDLVNWSAMQPLAPAVATGKGVADVTIASANGRDYVVYIDDTRRPRVEVAPAIGGPWSFVGAGTAALLMQNGTDNGLTHENFQLISIDGRWHILDTDYPPINPYLYTMVGTGSSDADWLSWNNGYLLTVATESFNTHLGASAAYVADWRSHDGFFYLFYAGNTEGTSHAGRGDCTIGVSRSMDLKAWVPAGM